MEKNKETSTKTKTGTNLCYVQPRAAAKSNNFLIQSLRKYYLAIRVSKKFEIVLYTAMVIREIGL